MTSELNKLIKENIDPQTQALRMDCYCLADALVDKIKEKITEPILNLMGGLNVAIKISEAINQAYREIKDDKEYK